MIRGSIRGSIGRCEGGGSFIDGSVIKYHR